MKTLGRLIGLFLALAGFTGAHVLVQVGNAQVPPLPTGTVTTAVPVPTVTAPLPPPPTPTPTLTTPTLPVPAPPPTTTTVAVPTVPPPPTVTVPPAPVPTVPTVPATTAPVPVAPAVPTATTPTVAAPSTGAPSSAGSPAPSSGPASGSTGGQASVGGGQASAQGTPVVIIGGAPSSGPGSSSPSASGTSPRAVLGARALEGRSIRTKGRVKVRLDFTLSRPARLFLVVRGPLPSCRVAGYIPVDGRRGRNTVVFAGRAQGRPLDPGLYLLSLSATRSVTPGAPSASVRVVSPRRTVPLPDSVSRPACTGSTSAPAGFTTTWISLVRAMPPAAVTPEAERPTAQIASAQNDDGDGQDAAGLLPSPGGALDGVTSGANEHPFAAIVVLALIAALLFAMVTLVTRFVRGSWNP